MFVDMEFSQQRAKSEWNNNFDGWIFFFFFENWSNKMYSISKKTNDQSNQIQWKKSDQYFINSRTLRLERKGIDAIDWLDLEIIWDWMGILN